MDVTTRPVSPSPATAHPHGLAEARASGAASGGRRPRAFYLRAAVAALVLAGVAWAAAAEGGATRAPVEFRMPSVDVVPLAP